jgi:hypothetical protein
MDREGEIVRLLGELRDEIKTFREEGARQWQEYSSRNNKLDEDRKVAMLRWEKMATNWHKRAKLAWTFLSWTVFLGMIVLLTILLDIFMKRLVR